MKLPINVSESIKRLNPDLYPMAAVQNSKRQQDKRGQSKDTQLEGSAKNLGYCVTIISFRKRLVDAHDNLRTGAKPLVDRITETLGFASDSDDRLRWEYHQIKTDSQEGTLVKIQPIECIEATNIPECV